MALDPVVLDDLTWADFNAAALQRIPAASGGLWTLNAPVDPGITLLDLFGWLLEQRVYWMDHVSDPLERALLNLLGIEPLPARAATTVFYLETPQVVTFDPTSGPPNPQFQLANGSASPVFTPNEKITIYPLAPPTKAVAKARPGRFRTPAVKLTVGGIDRSADLAQGRAPALFGPDGSDTRIVLSMAPSAPAPPAGTLALLFDLKTPPGLDPAWSPTAASGPAGPGTLTWLCTVKGTLTPLDSTKVVDTTLGLRRSGIVRLPIPDGWTAEPKSPADYAIVLRGSNTGWTTPPRVSRLIPNVVSAVHRGPLTEVPTQYTQDQVKTWRLLPGNVFVLPEDARPALADSLQVTITEIGDPKASDWKRVDDLTLYGPDDLVFVYDDASARIRFGDGVKGRLPVPKDIHSVTVKYQVGGGTAGNLGSSLAWEVIPAQSQTQVINAWNVVPAAGGLDAETLGAVRERAPEVLTKAERAITSSDFEALATQTPGTTLARAHASIGRHPLFPKTAVPGAITVFLVPDVPRNSDGSPDYGTDAPFPPGPVPDSPTLSAVQAALARARLVAGEVYVVPAIYRPVAIDVTITANPPDPQALRDAVIQKLRVYLDPLVGGDDGSGWPFGGPVRPSSLLKVAQDVVADAGTVDSIEIGLDDSAEPAQGCTDLAIGNDNLVVLTQVNVTIKLPTAGLGGLR
jgi:hypothetical protein